MFEFFSCVVGAIAVVAPVVQNLGEIAQGGQRILDLAGKILDRFRARVPDAQQVPVARAALAQAAAMKPEEFAVQAERLVEKELADKPPEYRAAVTEYVKLMPGRIRTAFARPEDPTGTTVPAKWVARRPEDLVPLLPPRPPLFKAGDSPPGAERWQLLKRLGIGGFGEVWMAQHEEIPDYYTAFKFCLDAAAYKSILENEMKNIAKVRKELGDHPHIVKLEDARIRGDAPWLQYEFIGGGELGATVAKWPREFPARVNEAVKVIKTLAGTVAHCHQLDVIHRDLKPGNVLVDRHGRLKITDFGISDTLARHALNEDRIATVSGVSSATHGVRWAHTPMYASEQQKDGHDPHPADDVHALGVLLYQLLKGDFSLRLGVDFRDDLAERHVCKELLDLLSYSVAATVERRFKHAGELAAALNRLPGELVRKPAPPVKLEDELDRHIEARYADADKKNAEAEQLCERREWAAALKVLATIRIGKMRRPDLVERAEAFSQGKRFINALGIEFVRVPKGTFWMGGQEGTYGDKQVTIDQDFYIGVYPVTQEEWQKVIGDTPSHFRKGGKGADKLTGISDADLKRFPVESVSWNRCQEFLQKLNERLKESGWMYRLPREAEWEYACRGGASSQADCAWSFYFKSPTNTLSAQQANFADSALQRTSKVGLYPANALGIHDMHGNVWEWCEDAHDGSSRVARGGCWSHSAECCRAAYRSWSAPSLRYNDLGLRLARVPVQ